MALTREEVVSAAIKLLDEAGLAGLTLRRLARALGISAPTLYWHVRDKRELLDLMADEIMAYRRADRKPMPENLQWWQIIEEGLRRSYHALIAHRDGALVVAGNRPTDAGLPFVERWLGVWMGAGFPPEEAMELVLCAGNYVVGSALEYQAEAERLALRGKPSPPQLDGKDGYPNLRRAVEARRRSKPDPHAAFEKGLSLLISGIRARREAIGNDATNRDGKEAVGT
jgi:TetR/AcrR family transcriptional regulator, tetracycline repressor protein